MNGSISKHKKVVNCEENDLIFHAHLYLSYAHIYYTLEVSPSGLSFLLMFCFSDFDGSSSIQLRITRA